MTTSMEKSNESIHLLGANKTRRTSPSLSLSLSYFHFHAHHYSTYWRWSWCWCYLFSHKPHTHIDERSIAHLNWAGSKRSANVSLYSRFASLLLLNKRLYYQHKQQQEYHKISPVICLAQSPCRVKCSIHTIQYHSISFLCRQTFVCSINRGKESCPTQIWRNVCLPFARLALVCLAAPSSSAPPPPPPLPPPGVRRRSNNNRAAQQAADT